jgi:hypothetical protein
MMKLKKKSNLINYFKKIGINSNRQKISFKKRIREKNNNKKNEE